MKNILLSGFLICSQFISYSQENEKKEFSNAIEDNSYFIEEAYNQEDRVVQHISNAIYNKYDNGFFNYSFTQEWPFFSQKHQVSYTVGFLFLESNTIRGLSDVMINYRYQLTSHDDFITLAPRASLIIPAGDVKKGLGDGAWGLQLNLPASKRISNSFVLHANLGYTLLPNVENQLSDTTTIKNNKWSTNFGASLIWLTTGKFNIMLETLHSIWGFKDMEGNMVTNNYTIISPGIRFAIDIKNLQIVPGIAVPVAFRDGSSNTGLFFYLSFEHPF